MSRGTWTARRVLLGLAIVVASIGAVQAVAGAVASGITMDEPTHVERARSWIEGGWYVPAQFMEDGEPVDGEHASPNLYGPAFAALAQAATFAAGLGPLDEVVTTASGWTLRHLLSALLGIATALAAGAGVFLITRSKLFSTWTVAALLAVPLWLGMSFFNPKDVPVAAGYTFVTVGLIAAISLARSRRGIERPAGLALTALIAAGTYLAIGTRIALWVPLAVAVLLYLAIVIAGRDEGGRPARGGIGYVAAGLGIGAAALLAVYPAAFANPIEALTDSIAGSSDFPWLGHTLTAGRLLDETPPLWYLPAWTIASVPLPTLLLAGSGLAWVVARAIRLAAGVRGPRRLLREILAERSTPVVLIALQALLLPIGSAAIGATMYTGIRQFLFIVPALAMLAGVGGAWLWRTATRSRRRVWRPVVVVALALALLIPMVEGTLLFPYNYAYVTPLAGVGGVNDRWETDYWWASSREAYARVPGDRVARCSASMPRRRPNGSIAAPPCATGSAQYLGPYSQGGSGPGGTDRRSQWVLVRRREGNEPLPGCDTADSVTRWLRGEQVVMSYVMRCPKGAPADASASVAAKIPPDPASR